MTWTVAPGGAKLDIDIKGVVTIVKAPSVGLEAADWTELVHACISVDRIARKAGWTTIIVN